MIRPEYLESVFWSEIRSETWPGAFAVLTAWNPYGEPAAPDENAIREKQLRSYCDEQGFMTWVIQGESPDGKYHESGVGVIVDLDTALVLGRMFEQEAIFWVENDQLSVISCEDPERQEMGKWSERVVGQWRVGANGAAAN